MLEIQRSNRFRWLRVFGEEVAPGNGADYFVLLPIGAPDDSAPLVVLSQDGGGWAADLLRLDTDTSAAGLTLDACNGESIPMAAAMAACESLVESMGLDCPPTPPQDAAPLAPLARRIRARRQRLARLGR